MQLRDRILASDLSFVRGGFDSFDPLFKERKKALESLRRQLHNECPSVTRFEYSCEQCKSHKSPLVAKILTALNQSGLQDYSLYQGKAFSVRYFGSDLRFEEEQSEEVYELRSKKEGFSLQFRIVEKECGAVIHVLFLKRATSHQGCFWQIKRILCDEVWGGILEPAGFHYLYGRAVFSTNSEIKIKSPREKDWRYTQVYAGLNKDLKPIFISGIQLMYLRMNFLPMQPFISSASEEMVFLLASHIEAKLRDSVTDNQWDEITKYRTAENKRWKEVVREREELIGAEELQKLKNRSLKILSNKDWRFQIVSE